MNANSMLAAVSWEPSASILIALLALAIIWAIVSTLSKEWDPLKWIRGQDGLPSTSKFQFLLWTIAAIFGYVAIYASRAFNNTWTSFGDAAPNLLIAMGLSAGTATLAKVITTGLVQSGKVVKDAATNPPVTTANSTAVVPAANPGVAVPGIVPVQNQILSVVTSTLNPHSGFQALVNDDDNNTDLSKIQMLAWTFVAIGTFLYKVVSEIYAHSASVDLPDISQALMVLMGVGQGAYLAKKLTTSTVSKLSGITPSTGRPTTSITIAGLGFGNSPDGNTVTMDGHPVPWPAAGGTWSDTQIVLPVPATPPVGTAWAPTGQKVDVGVTSSGQPSSNTLPFTVTPP